MKLFNPPQAEADTSRLSSSGCFVTGQKVTLRVNKHG